MFFSPFGARTVHMGLVSLGWDTSCHGAGLQKKIKDIITVLLTDIH